MKGILGTTGGEDNPVCPQTVARNGDSVMVVV